MEDKAYLSILDWPAGFDDDAKIRAMSAACGLDEFTAQQCARRGVPQVAFRTEAALAPDMLDRLHRLGVTAIAPTQSQMRAVPDAKLVKRLEPAAGSPFPMYSCEFWRSDPEPLVMRDVFLIVRARIASREHRTRPNDARGMSLGVVAPEVAWLDAATPYGDRAGATRSTSVDVKYFLELHLDNGARFRIDTRKFSFDVLGPDRAPVDAQNVDPLAIRFARQAPRAIVDTSFEHFRCPADVVRTHFHHTTGGTSIRRTSDAPAFEFYSAWCAMMYRALLGKP